VVVYDANGALGGPAVRQLTAQGFTRAFALRGGLAAWRADNLPVSRA
jgi:rhodanese-related sulfurtransferase